MLIGVSGYSGTGKDTIGIIIQYLKSYNLGDVSLEEAIEHYNNHQWWLEDQSEWEIKKFAGKLKQIASLLTGIPQERFEDQEFKKTNLGEEWNINVPYISNAPWVGEGETVEVPMTVRDFLQKLGTNALRDQMHENVWVNALMADYKPKHSVEFSVTENGSRLPTAFNTSYPNWIITDTRFPNEAKAIKKAGGIVIRVERPGFKPVNNHPSETSLDGWQFDYKIANVSDIEALCYTVENILRKIKIL